MNSKEKRRHTRLFKNPSSFIIRNSVHPKNLATQRCEREEKMKMKLMRLLSNVQDASEMAVIA